METNFFEWGRLVMMGMQLIVSGVGLGAILVGLVRMKEAGARRDREIDEPAAAFRQQGRALERQGQVMTQAFRQQGQALERQGQVLAELLRRTA